ncbi:cell wall elongation regulator TseB-like domain-containing protein [Cytobacillus dafuensis]|uniref:Peptidase n=1 Tax=Cytobacillus dafuensis TaxID=1742359 RepID=A0A5B8Z5S5_CYTDA|nr:DUF5590 domain-containing protein [Cytobacillus dafuensis]QED48405.1 peptidase [Cytobacillus dafuensis]
MKKIIIIFLIILAVGLGSGIFVYLKAVEPVKAAEKKAIEIALKETRLKEVDDFQLYNGQETYYVLKGKDKNGTALYVWIPENEGRIIVRNVKDGVTKQEALNKLKEEKNPKEIISIRLGIENNIPLWEIYYRTEGDLINYYYVDFETGKWRKNIENL